MMKGYENLKLGESLSNKHLYPSACADLSLILNSDWSRSPKKLKDLIFRDTLSAFRLLPHVDTSAAVSAANLLLKRVKTAALPKQKKNLAILEFKQAKAALKRRRLIKNPEEGIDLSSLPEDILIHIFSFLDVSSLLSSSQVSWSWKQAAYDKHLWRSQFDIHFNYMTSDLMKSDIDWRQTFKEAYIVNNMIVKVLSSSGRGYSTHCDSIVWRESRDRGLKHNNRC